MDFYYAPTTCSQAAHILLHEAGLAHHAHKVDVFTRNLTDGGDYQRINPNGYVPALVLGDGYVLTENVALLDWIAARGRNLVPTGDMGRTRHLQMLAFISTELQKPFVRFFFSQSDDEKAYLTQVLAQRFDWIRSQMRGPFLFGDHFSASDAFAYVMLRWASLAGFDMHPDLRDLAGRIEQRDSVQQVLAKEEVEPLRTAA
jgi:glutathione S-transferase